ncbi:MAG: hypothetical protein JWP02_2794 [Acidimicrobiales bacterium]|nr:hypothetical protein [Acidimicrobiales bacterium]
MSAVWTRVRAEARARARSMVVLALVLGVAGGAALAAFAGARRTDSAVDRFLAFSKTPNANVGAPDPETLDKILALPQVADSVVGAYMLMAPLDASGRPDRKGDLGTQALVGGGIPDIGRPKILAGRFPRDRVDEAFLNASGAAATGLRVGSRVRLQGWDPKQADELLRGAELPPTGPVAEVRVVGIGRFPFELSTTPATPGVIYTSSNFLLLPPAFYRAYGERVAVAGGPGGSVRLERGVADYPAFQAAVQRISPDAFVDAATDDVIAGAKAKRATSVEALALLLFGILAGLVAVALVAQALVRQAFLDATDYPALGAMGMTRGQLVAVAAVRATMIGVAGAAVAVAFAVLLSPAMPIGLARQAEVHRGYSFDASIILIGALAIVAFVVAAAALAAWRTARAVGVAPGPVSVGPEQPSRLTDRLARTGVSPSAVVGVRMALEPGRGATAVPVRTTLVSAAVAVAVVVGTLTFGASLHRLATTPVLQGWNWDVSVGNPHSDDISETAVPALDRNPDVAAFSAVSGPGSIRAGRVTSSVMGMDTVKGAVLPPFLDGRAPHGQDEIAFGTKDLRRMHRSVGQSVVVSAGDQPPRTMRVVGRMVLTPSIVNGQIHLGDGALVTMATFKAMSGGGGNQDSENVAENVFVVRFKPGVQPAPAVKRLQHDFPGTVLTALRPADVENLRRVSALPSVLAGLFAAVALLTVGHMLVSSVRRRRHDVAILRTMGFVRRQVSAAVAWQATTVVVVALVVGLPVGIALGRWTWAVVAGQLGVLSLPVVPALVIAGVTVGALVIANAVASLPGLLAARTRPAEILRTE